MSERAADLLEELADLTEECPTMAAKVPLHHLAAIFNCSPEAIELAEELAAAPEWPPSDVANDVIESMSVHEMPRLIQRSDIPGESGAVRQWRLEIAANARRKTDMDALAVAACYEMSAREEIAAGLWAAARQSRDAAIDIIIESTARQTA